jgi:REP element-mobilizing transposase RayT
LRREFPEQGQVILAHHAILTTYGFWLPNDPRGSWSRFVGSWELFRFGKATTTDLRRSLAADPHDHELRFAAKKALKYPVVRFDGHQALSVGRGFAAAVAERGYRIYACSILPDHVHLVVARSDRRIEQIMTHLKAKATAQLTRDGRHPLAEYRTPRGTVPTPWTEKGWSCFLDSTESIARAIRYVEENPAKQGKPRQRGSFVAPWEPAC